MLHLLIKRKQKEREEKGCAEDGYCITIANYNCHHKSLYSKIDYGLDRLHKRENKSAINRRKKKTHHFP